jgi:NAD-dependent deacetylase
LETSELATGDLVSDLANLILSSNRIVAFTGAGISTESGIPDYRGPGGVWERQAPPTIGDYLENPETRRAFWAARKNRYPELASRQPNQGHYALAHLERIGKLDLVITQNIDGLHQAAGNSPDRVVELHGSAHQVRCLTCGTVYTGAEIQARQDEGEEIPDCLVCGGILRTATILFGESLPREALDRAVAASRAADLMLVIGSSLVVNPAARLPGMTKKSGGKVAIINRTATPHDNLADIHIVDEAGPTLSRLIEIVAG